jgi:hypothetical protein
VIFAAHQPNFLPWLGFFDKIRRAERFVLVDHVQFARGDFQNRNKILTRDGPRWLTVPVRQRSRDERIFEKEIDPKTDRGMTWGQRVVETLRHAYARAPHFERTMPFFEDAFTRPWERLLDLNVHLIRHFLTRFEIATPIVLSTSLGEVEGQKSEMVLSLCKKVGATVYLSGSGGSREYLDTGLFERSGIEVRWQDFGHPRYPQLGVDDFNSHLSAIDLLMWCGPASAEILRSVETVKETVNDTVNETADETAKERAA